MPYGKPGSGSAPTPPPVVVVVFAEVCDGYVVAQPSVVLTNTVAPVTAALAPALTTRMLIDGVQIFGLVVVVVFGVVLVLGTVVGVLVVH